ncbi:MAG TPA: archaeosortase A [Methanosarcinales archaeon]|nr:archaeosortase A [Methanosarcinales archaeon]
MIENLLWIALLLLIIASILPNKSYKNYKFLIGGFGWIFFSIHWFLQPFHYLETVPPDYFNVVLTILVAIFCVFIGYVMLRNAIIETNESDKVTTLFSTTSVTAIVGIFYFPFAEITTLNRLIISTVTDQTVSGLWLFGIPVIRSDWNLIDLNGYRVEIILACTAIESIVLFIGLITSVNADFKRKFMAFMVSVPVIYILNLIRNIFVIAAYGEQWFGQGEKSFLIAHGVLAKIGSAIALFIIAYLVFKILPELLDLIDGIWKLLAFSIGARS